MDVDVLLDSGTGGLAQVDPDVEPLRSVQVGQDAGGLGGQFHHLRAGLRVEGFQRGLMGVGQHHHMPACVRKKVENDKSPFSAEHDQVFGGIFFRKRIAKDTSFFCLWFLMYVMRQGEKRWFMDDKRPAGGRLRKPLRFALRRQWCIEHDNPPLASDKHLPLAVSLFQVGGDFLQGSIIEQ